MLNDARTHLEIRETTDSVWKSRLMSVLAIILFITTIAAYFFGKHQAEFEWQAAVEALALLEDDFAATVKENRVLQQSLEFEKAKSVRDAQIKRQAYDEIAQTLASTSNEVADLKENIRFYESIIADDKKTKGLQVKSVTLHAVPADDQYRYKVIIVNSGYGKNKSKGTLTIEVEGLQDGELKIIKIPPADNEDTTALLFKYFQRVEGILALPEGFLPQRLRVTARLSGKKGAKIEKWYNWDILVNPDLPGDG